jgi:hypothetical protein
VQNVYIGLPVLYTNTIYRIVNTKNNENTMSKNKSMSNASTQNTPNIQNTQETAATTATSEVQETVVPPTAPTSPTAPSSEVAVRPTAGVDLVTNVEARLRLFQHVPEGVQGYIEYVPPPAKGEVMGLVQHLNEAKRQNMQQAFKRMNPVKIGQHVAIRQNQLPEMRIYHGMGTDEQRPADAPTGCFYSTDGRVITAQKANLATLRHNPKYKDLRETIGVYIVGVQSARTFWPPRQNQTVDLPEGIEIRGNAPICRSLDRVRGEVFGDCDACEHRPFKDKEANPTVANCRNEDHIYVVLADFSGIYRLSVSGTSMPTAASMGKKSKTWEFYWQHAFELSLTEETKNGNRVFELKADVLPEESDPTPEESDLLNAIARQIDYEVYLPGMERIYAAKYVSSVTGNNKMSQSGADQLAKLAAMAGGGGGGGGNEPPKNVGGNL